jgi:hypothetical protein
MVKHRATERVVVYDSARTRSEVKVSEHGLAFLVIDRINFPLEIYSAIVERRSSSPFRGLLELWQARVMDGNAYLPRLETTPLYYPRAECGLPKLIESVYQAGNNTTKRNEVCVVYPTCTKIRRLSLHSDEICTFTGPCQSPSLLLQPTSQVVRSSMMIAHRNYATTTSFSKKSPKTKEMEFGIPITLIRIIEYLLARSSTRL